MADEIIRMQDIYAEDIVGNINEVREARGTFESLDARLDNIDGGNAPSPSTSDPAMDGTASPGSADTYSRGDHVHPTDTSRQAVIDSSHKLSSDLVDDTNNTNKFATAAQLQQISTNETNISSILDGTTIDSFGDVETALSGKQATLTTAQLAAVNSGIDSTKVAQIETNKNNISFNTNNGVKNLLNFDADTMKSVNTGGTWNGNTWSLGNNVTLTINSDKSITLNGTANAGKTIYLAKNLGMAEKAYTLSTGALTTKLWAGITEVGGTENSYTGSTTHIDKTCQPNHITLYVENGCALSNFTVYPMLTLKSLYDADSTYQPYALSNTVITPALGEAVDNGAKNVYQITNVPTVSRITISKTDTNTISINGTFSSATYVFFTLSADNVVLPAGSYVVYTKTTGTMPARTLTISSDVASCTLGSYAEFTLATDKQIGVYVQFLSNDAVNGTISIMICPKALWDISHKYEPYAMSNVELTEEVATQEAGFINSTGSATTLTIEGLNTSDNPNCLLMCTDLRDTDAKDSLLLITRYLTNARINKVYGDITPPTISISGDVITLSGMRTYQKITAIAHKHVTLST